MKKKSADFLEWKIWILLKKAHQRPQQANLQVYTIEGNHSTRDRKKALNWTSGNNLPPSFWETRLHVREYLVLNKIIINGIKKKKKCKAAVK